MSSVEAPAGIAEQLMALRALTQTTGVVHEAQVFQLRIWGLVALSHLHKQEFQVLPEAQSVTYRAASAGRKPADLPARLKSLEESIKWLFGSEWVLKVDVAGTAIFPTGQKKPHVRSCRK
jgi:hypothetical protein